MTIGKMTIDKMTSGKMTIDKMTIGKSAIGKMTIGRITIGKMSIGRITIGKMTIAGKTMKLHHSTDASTFPRFKLTCFVHIMYFSERINSTSF
jgi:hypothetical protein